MNCMLKVYERNFKTTGTCDIINDISHVFIIDFLWGVF